MPVRSPTHSMHNPRHVPSFDAKSRCVKALLHIIRILLACMLMLMVMSFNGFVLLALLFGYGTGYYYYHSDEQRIGI